MSLIILAFGIGLVSFFSPCLLPLIGIYFSVITGLSIEELKSMTSYKLLRQKVLLNTIAFISGFGVIFIAMGTLVGKIGSWLARWEFFFNILGGTLMLVLAISMLGLAEFRLFNRLSFDASRFIPKRRRFGPLTSFLVGLIFSLAILHCAAPLILSVLTMAGQVRGPLRGAGLMLGFTAGVALPYLFVALNFGWFLRRIKGFGHRQVLIQRIVGLFMLYIAYLMYTGKLHNVIEMLEKFLP